MQTNYGKIQSAGLGLAAISYDRPSILKSFADRQHITFSLLSDPDSGIIRSFGILNPEPKRGTPTFGIPNPGIYVLDRHGVVTAKYFEDDYRERDTAAVILMKQFGIAPEAPHASVRAKHLALSASASTPRARMGQHIELILDIDLPARVHVYAPGVQGYIPIDWAQTDSVIARPQAAIYPSAERMSLPVINEVVPVYTGHFRLTREIVIGPDKAVLPLLDASGNLTVEGKLRYQACDDQKCFLPEDVPLKWTFHFDPLDKTRVPAN